MTEPQLNKDDDFRRIWWNCASSAESIFYAWILFPLQAYTLFFWGTWYISENLYEALKENLIGKGLLSRWTKVLPQMLN